MRLAELYLRSRSAPLAVTGLALLTVLAYAVLRWFDDPSEALRVTLILGPLAAATIIGIGTYSPFGESERASSFPLARLRLAHLGGLLLLGALALGLVVMPWQEQDGPLSTVRNVAGLGGLGLLGARLLGARLSWIAPLAFGVAALFASIDAIPRWAWPAMPGLDGEAMAVAVTLVVLGLGVAGRWGARDARDETP